MDQASAKLHQSSIIIDCLEISNWSEAVFKNWQKGGLTAVICTCSVLEGFRRTIKNLVWWRRAFEQHSDLIMPVLTTTDIKMAKHTGRTGVILDFQNTSAIEEDLELLTTFHDLGVRVIQLCYMEGNLCGQGCLERIDAGLTNFGIDVIEEMNRLGILVDLSHVGHRTTMDAIEASSKPVAFTHANPKSICDHPRNKPDEAIKALAAKGGVIGATVFPPFLPRGNDSTVDDFVAVVDYLADMIGIDHVAVGTDFTQDQDKSFFDWLLGGRSQKEPALKLDHPLKMAPGIQSAADFPNLTEAFSAHGYSDADIRKVMGGNMLRLLGQVWNEPRPADADRESFAELKAKLDLTEEQRLMLDTVPMVLMPRWFFVAIKKQTENLCDRETARRIYYQAGWEGAEKWAQVQMEAGLTGRAVMEQYMNSAAIRGWGRTEITEYDENAGRVVVKLNHSSVAEETGSSDLPVCDHLPGSVAGAMTAILEHKGIHKQLIGKETKCLSQGKGECVFEVGPADK